MLPVDPKRQEEIEQEAIELYTRKMAEERAKTAEQREAETLTAEIGSISAQLREMQKFPSRHRQQIQTAADQMESKQKRLDELQGKPAPTDWRVEGNRAIQMIGGKVFVRGKLV